MAYGPFNAGVGSSVVPGGFVMEEDGTIVLAGGGVASVSIDFTAEQWLEGVLTITQAEHKRGSDAFIYSLYHNLDGTLAKTWAVMDTVVAYNAETGDITLTCSDTYNGRIVLAG